MKINTVLLDTGGVILDETESNKVAQGIAVGLLKIVVPEYTADDFIADINEAVNAFIPHTYQHIFKKHCNDNTAKFNKYYVKFLEKWLHQKPQPVLCKGISAEILQIHKNFDICIAGPYNLEVICLLEKKYLLDYFNYRMTNPEYDISGHDPDYFKKLAYELDFDLERSIMVGNRLDNDIIPAKEVGMKTILVRTGIHKGQQPRSLAEAPDLELDTVSGLSDAVYELAKRFN